MDFTRIETARLFLRPYTRDHLDALHRLWTDPDVRRYLFDDEIMERAWVAAEIEHSLACFEAHGFGQWAMFLKGHDALIGFGGYRFIPRTTEVATPLRPRARVLGGKDSPPKPRVP